MVPISIGGGHREGEKDSTGVVVQGQGEGGSLKSEGRFDFHLWLCWLQN